MRGLRRALSGFFLLVGFHEGLYAVVVKPSAGMYRV